MKKKLVITTSVMLAIAILGTTPIITNIADASSTTTTSTTKKSRIGLSKAKKIALKNAKLSSSDVTFTKAKYDKDDKEYDIEFYTSSKEYDYEIDAYSGKIEEKEVETKKTTTTSKKKITKSKAKQVALKHAGFSSSSVKFDKVELDEDDGNYEYELEFTKGKYEYEYTIDAYTGEVLDFDKDYND